MKCNDIINEGYYEISDDSLVMRHLDDTRRPKITLRHLHDLRLSNEFNKKENAVRMSQLPDIYHPAPTE